MSISSSPRARAIIECTHITSLAIWLAATLGATLTAALAFPILKSLHPTLPDYPSFQDQHYLIAAGSVAQRGFLIADLVQFPASIIAVITLAVPVVFMNAPIKRPAGIVRMLTVAVALAACASLLLIVTPQLTAATQAHWAAMKAGDAAAVARHKASVDEIHPVASRLTGTMAISVLIALIAAVWSLARPWTASEPRLSVYQEPKLASSKLKVRQ